MSKLTYDNSYIRYKLMFGRYAWWNSWWVIIAACSVDAGEVRRAGSDANEVATLSLRDCCRVTTNRIKVEQTLNTACIAVYQ